MSVLTARQDPHLRRFPLRRRAIQVAGGDLRLVVPASAHALLARSPSAAARAARGELPHWADVWPASVALARKLARGPSLQGVRVVDLGCGLGVAGLAAARRGACVTFLDRDEDALRFADFNARSLGLRDHVIRSFDWNVDVLPTGTDLLILADVWYAWRHGPPLLRHVTGVIDEGGTVLCADPFRPTAADFLMALAARWPDRTRVEETSVGGLEPGQRVPVRVVEVAGSRR